MHFNFTVLYFSTETQAAVKQVTVSVSLDECYVVHNRKAVVVNSANFSSPDKAAIKQIISDIIEKLRT